MPADQSTDHDPEAVATYVWFERDMFNRVFERVEQGLNDDQFLENILVASFLLHARNLRYFLFDEPRLDDVSAQHFLPEWDEKVEKWCRYLHENRERLNKSLAHISYKRIEYESDKEWEYVKIHTELTAAWDKFFSSLPEEKQKWFTGPRERAVGVTRL